MWLTKHIFGFVYYTMYYIYYHISLLKPSILINTTHRSMIARRRLWDTVQVNFPVSTPPRFRWVRARADLIGAGPVRKKSENFYRISYDRSYLYRSYTISYHIILSKTTVLTVDSDKKYIYA